MTDRRQMPSFTDEDFDQLINGEEYSVEDGKELVNELLEWGRNQPIESLMVTVELDGDDQEDLNYAAHVLNKSETETLALALKMGMAALTEYVFQYLQD